MRPDEHKKKRSAQYQKKHGASKDKNEGDDKKGAGKQSKSKGKHGGAGKQLERTQHQKAPPPSRHADVSTSDSEEEEEASAVPKKTYRGREIASNWGKYDLPPPDADSAAAPKGQDFNKLLDLTSSALAHFRFKEEQAWEEELERDGDREPALTLDCEQLATSLDCLPLYTQLHLDKHIFTPEQVTAMDEKAKAHRASIPGLEENASIGTSPQAQDLKSTADGTTSSSSFNKTSPSEQSTGKTLQANDYKTKDNTGASSKEKESAVKPSVGITDEELDALLDADNDVKERSSLAASAVKTPATVLKGGLAAASTVEKMDEELDALLEGDSDVNRQSNPVSSKAQAPAKASNEALSGVSTLEKRDEGFMDKDLDDLLSADNVPTTPEKNEQPASSETEGAAAESAELEDWLDSMLDG